MQINTKNIENKIVEFQTGNQTKARVDGTWYKADYLGYEGAAEYVASSILKYSNIKNYVNYDLCNISYMKEGEINISMGCK